MLSLVQSARMMSLVRADFGDDEMGSATALSLVGGGNALSSSRRESFALPGNSQHVDLSGSGDYSPSRMQDPTVAAQFLSSGMQAAWRLTHWQEVERFSSSTLELPKEDFEVNVARCLLSLVKRDQPGFAKLLLQTRADVMGPLLAASMDSYQRSFPYLVCLHMLSELEEMGTCLLASEPVIKSNFEWNARLKMTSASFRGKVKKKTIILVISFFLLQIVRQGILHLRRVVSQIQSPNSVGACCKNWVEIARAARVDGQLEAARSALIQALSVDPNNMSALIERARLLYIQGNRQMAILEVEQVIKAASSQMEIVLDMNLSSEFELQKQRAKPELLLGQWLHETGQKPFEGIRDQFQRVVKMCPEWENGHFFVASYLDQVMKSSELDSSDKKTVSSDKKPVPKDSLKLLPDVVKGYRLALENGYKHIHHSLSRMLTLYFEYGSELYLKKVDTSLQAIEHKLHEEMRLGISKIPMYVWLGAMPQLISRVCHDNPAVKKELSNLIQKVFQAFPKQVMWLAVGVLRALHRAAARKEIKEILEKVTCKDEAAKNAYQQTLELADLIAALSHHKVADATVTRLKISDFADLTKLRKFRSTSVVIPSEAALVGALPLSGRPEKDWNAFGETQPTSVHQISDEVEVIRSLQSPKVFTIIGSNGVPYRFLAKPEDDLRKDSRVMEVNSLVNKLLSRDADSRRRQLRIQTFSVVPLDEKNGLIEWVSNCQTYRSATAQFYNAKQKAVKDVYDKLKAAQPAARYMQCASEFPLRFHQWFAVKFPEPMSWLDARMCYTRSCAVMSIVGTVIGLGDRHGDNILLNTKTGHVMHVDFNAIFNKGETFQVPERVPFRLTRNMVDAMGLSGYEGAFRRVCEITMHVLRQHREMVLSVLETFLYDPLVEFTLIKDPSVKAKGAAPTVSTKKVQENLALQKNEKALEIVTIIDRRLQGKVESGVVGASRNNVSRAVALSVEGHIEHLIQQAISPANLGAMFVGWAPCNFFFFFFFFFLIDFSGL
jgi:serine/threonine-protein kinase ATR